jgi:hydroxymethylglutaryl-CoA synthase
VGEAIGATPNLLAADWEFACKAGTEAMQAGVGMVGSGMIDYALVLGMDAAQGRPGDALEYTAGAGGAAFLIGPAEEALAVIEASYSFVTDTPDFWRRSGANYPSHGQRFTGDPAYFRHVLAAGRALLEATGTKPGDYRYAVFHQPNPKFPQRAAETLGFTKEQIRTGMLAPQIGNTYAGSALIGLTAILDEAAPGDKILLVSFGSGAGSDAFQLTATGRLPERRAAAPGTGVYIARRKEIDYGVYVRYRGKLKM